MAAAWLFVVGMCVGSFINTIVDRWPTGMSVATKPSFCDSCGKRLAAKDLIPFVSYMWLRGRCRYCGVRIPPRMWITEMTVGILFATSFLRYPFGVTPFVVSIFCALLITIAIIDLEHGLILNTLAALGLALGLLLAPWWPWLGVERSFLIFDGWAASSLNSVAAGLVAFAAFLALAILTGGAMGYGDVKLAGVLGIILGFPGILIAVWVAAICGGAVAAFLILTRRKNRKDPIPFGPFLAAGTVAALLVPKGFLLMYIGIA